MPGRVPPDPGPPAVRRRTTCVKWTGLILPGDIAVSHRGRGRFADPHRRGGSPGRHPVLNPAGAAHGSTPQRGRPRHAEASAAAEIRSGGRVRHVPGACPRCALGRTHTHDSDRADREPGHGEREDADPRVHGDAPRDRRDVRRVRAPGDTRRRVGLSSRLPTRRFPCCTDTSRSRSVPTGATW